jgi:membrane protease YdiL (CAAX protease family)
VSEAVAIARALAREASRSPLLIAYCALGVVSCGLWLDKPWPDAVANYALLLPLYAFAIRWWTRHDAPLDPDRDAPPRAAWRDALALALVVAIIAALAVYFALHPRAPAPAPPPAPPDGAAHLRALAADAARSLAIHGAIVLALCAILRAWPRALRPRRLGLGLALAALGLAFAALGELAGMRLALPLFAMPALALPVFAVQLFVNGLPEEVLFRGVALPRFLHRLRAPVPAIVASSLLFTLAHVPIQVWDRGDTPIWQIVARSLANQPTGLVWGYLCYRTRSVWPGVLWHTAASVFAFLFY